MAEPVPPPAVELAGALSPVPGQVGGVKLLGEGALSTPRARARSGATRSGSAS